MGTREHLQSLVLMYMLTCECVTGLGRSKLQTYVPSDRLLILGLILHSRVEGYFLSVSSVRISTKTSTALYPMSLREPIHCVVWTGRYLLVPW